MKNKTAILLTLFFLFNFNSFGQSQLNYTDGVTKLISWFSDIDKILTNISDKEKLKRIYRQLGYVSEDIDNIALGKQILVSELDKLSSPSQQNQLNELKPKTEDILNDIDLLISRLESIKSDVSQTDQVVVDEIIQKINSVFKTKISYLQDIKYYLDYGGGSISIIKKEANQAKQNAVDSSVKIKEAKLRIKSKINLL